MVRGVVDSEQSVLSSLRSNSVLLLPSSFGEVVGVSFRTQLSESPIGISLTPLDSHSFSQSFTIF